MQIRVVLGSVRQNERGLESVQVSLVSRRNLQSGRLDFDETFDIKPAPHEGQNPRTGHQPGVSLAVSLTVPKRFAQAGSRHGAEEVRYQMKSMPIGLWR